MHDKLKAKTKLTRRDILQACGPLSADPATDARLRRIEADFADGFAFLDTVHRAVSIFGSTILPENDPYYQDARRLANKLVTEGGFTVITGGGPGIMEAANRGASEAGGVSVGLNIELRNNQPSNQYINRSENFHYFFARKVALAFSARVYIFYPGGFGTLNEFTELVMLVQTEKIQPIPIICVGSDFWNPIKKLMGELLKVKFGVIDDDDLSLFQIVDDHDKILQTANEAARRT